MSLIIFISETAYHKSVTKSMKIGIDRKTFRGTSHTRQNRLTRICKTFLKSLLVNIYVDQLLYSFLRFIHMFTNWRISRFFRRLIVIIWNYWLRHGRIVTKHITYSGLNDLTRTSHHLIELERFAQNNL